VPQVSVPPNPVNPAIPAPGPGNPANPGLQIQVPANPVYLAPGNPLNLAQQIPVSTAGWRIEMAKDRLLFPSKFAGRQEDDAPEFLRRLKNYFPTKAYRHMSS